MDMLLWDFNPEADGSKNNRSDSTKSAWLASVVHAAVGIGMRALSFQLTDIAFMLFQDTVPGPWQSSATSADTAGKLWLSNANVHRPMVQNGTTRTCKCRVFLAPKNSDAIQALRW